MRLYIILFVQIIQCTYTFRLRMTRMCKPSSEDENLRNAQKQSRTTNTFLHFGNINYIV